MLNNLFNPFKKPSAEVLAQQELEEAQREVLVAQSHAEYYKNLVNYHQMRITRLQAMQRLNAN